MMSTVLANVDNGFPTKRRMHTKGGAEFVIQSCSHIYSFEDDSTKEITPQILTRINNSLHEMADNALRIICLAYKDLEGDEDLTTVDERGVFEIEKSGLTLLALVGIRDRIRPGVKEAIQKCRRAGIKVRMVTGDNLLTAKAIARECGILDVTNPNSLIMEGRDFMEMIGGIVYSDGPVESLEDGSISDALPQHSPKKNDRQETIGNPANFNKIYKELDVLARCRPEDKYALVLGLI
mmetsp:Transcript_41765/g.37187  ORF Transcript_41765/g.37187 Transcript_41765/m.37187 type:complete len:237 (-) Transcript_41765:1346-2056(-)